MRILAVLGTRPEAIKMAPVITQLKNVEDFECRVCLTAQHRIMLDHVIGLFGIKSDYDLNIMGQSQDLTDITCNVLKGVREILKQWRPDWVLIQGDTTTAFSAALAAFYEKIDVGHIEAGLRTYDIYSPWPEEANRRFASIIARLNFAPTEGARQNLLREGVPDDRIRVTGNTVIDALQTILGRIGKDEALRRQMEARFSFLSTDKKMILATAHRRESWGSVFEEICLAIRDLSERGDIEIVFPVHLNSNVKAPVERILGGIGNVHLLEPQEYLPFVYLMLRCSLILTDSGGIQEEGPSIGKPVLVMRKTTERPEGLMNGMIRMVGTERNRIVHETVRLITNKVEYAAINFGHNPYGDGMASVRIIEELMIGAKNP